MPETGRRRMPERMETYDSPAEPRQAYRPCETFMLFMDGNLVVFGGPEIKPATRQYPIEPQMHVPWQW